MRKYYPDWEYIEIGIKPVHVHLYIVIPPKYAVNIVQKLSERIPVDP